MSRPGSVKGLPEGPPLGALDGFRSAQMMISAGDGPFLAGTPLWTFVASCRGAARRARGLARPRPVGVTAASWCGPVPGVTRARPPAVAVTGLRWSGRTGNGEGSRGRIAPACQPGRSVHARSRCAAARPGQPRRQAHGALRAPLKT